MLVFSFSYFNISVSIKFRGVAEMECIMSFIKIIKEIDIIIVMSIAVAGWFFTYKFTIKAQNKIFLNNIMNTARIDIIDSINKYQDCLYKTKVIFVNLRFSIVHALVVNKLTESQKLTFNWNEKILEIKEIFESSITSSHEVINKLEEYEILFYKTKECRIGLLEKHKAVRNFFDCLLNEMEIANTPLESRMIENIKSVLENYLEKDSLVFDQTPLMNDLKIYFQNF